MAYYSFSLSRSQRILNPPEQWLFAILGCAPLFGALVLLCAAPFVTTGWAAYAASELILLLFGSAAFLFVGRRNAIPIWSAIFTSTYINTIEITKESVKFGIDGLDAVLPNNRLVRVSRGLLGVTIVRNVAYGYAFVVPKEVITILELKNSL